MHTNCCYSACISFFNIFNLVGCFGAAQQQPNRNEWYISNMFLHRIYMRSDEVLRPRVCATQLCIWNTHFSLYTLFHWFVVQFVRRLVVTHIWCSDCMHSESLNNEHKPTESWGTHSTAAACIFFSLLLIFTLWLHLVSPFRVALLPLPSPCALFVFPILIRRARTLEMGIRETREHQTKTINQKIYKRNEPKTLRTAEKDISANSARSKAVQTNGKQIITFKRARTPKASLFTQMAQGDLLRLTRSSFLFVGRKFSINYCL